MGAVVAMAKYTERTDAPVSEILPVSAERIELHLAELWQHMDSDRSTSRPLSRVCLANVIILSDPDTHSGAGRLADEMANIHPSRIISACIGEDVPRPIAYVRASCDFSAAGEHAVCWEVVDIEVSPNDGPSLLGATRSLLIGVVPTLLVDFRSVQTLPGFTEKLTELSDLAVVSAELVPTRATSTPVLPLRWFHTLPIRVLLSDLFGTLARARPDLRPERFTFGVDEHGARLDVLLSGWIAGRLQADKIERVGELERTASYQGKPISLVWSQEGRDKDDRRLMLQVDFADNSRATIHGQRTGNKSRDDFLLAYNEISRSRSSSATGLGKYIVEVFKDPAELEDYDLAREFVRKIDIV